MTFFPGPAQTGATDWTGRRHSVRRAATLARILVERLVRHGIRYEGDQAAISFRTTMG